MRLFITFQSGVPSSSPTHFPTDGSDTATAMKANKESLPGFTAEGKKEMETLEAEKKKSDEEEALERMYGNKEKKAAAAAAAAEAKKIKDGEESNAAVPTVLSAEPLGSSSSGKKTSKTSGFVKQFSLLGVTVGAALFASALVVTARASSVWSRRAPYRRIQNRNDGGENSAEAETLLSSVTISELNLDDHVLDYGEER